MDIYKCINIDTSLIKKRLKERCINNAGKTMDIYKCINIDISFICPLFYLHYLYISPLVFFINDVSILIHLYMSIVLPALFIHLSFSLYKCINIDISFIKKTKGEMHK
jgi:hypothetical protein